MALCPADAIIECDGQIDADVIGKHILNWALDFDAFNKNVLGPTSKIALNAIRDGKPVSELENNGVTNGAAMRASRWAACSRPRVWNILWSRWRWPPARPINRILPSPVRWWLLGGFPRHRRRTLAEHRRCPAGYRPLCAGGENDHLQRIAGSAY